MVKIRGLNEKATNSDSSKPGHKKTRLGKRGYMFCHLYSEITIWTLDFGKAKKSWYVLPSCEWSNPENPVKLSSSNVSWTFLRCIPHVRGYFVINEIFNFSEWEEFSIQSYCCSNSANSVFRPKTNHFQALRAPVIRAHKFVHKSLLSTLKILLRIDHVYFTQRFYAQKAGNKSLTAAFDTLKAWWEC